MSTVIISAILLIMAAIVARDGFWQRASVLDRENKKISVQLAEACVNAVLLGLSKGEGIPASGAEITIDGPKKCEIDNISGANPYAITAHASWKNSYTNLEATVKFENGKSAISEWREI